MGPFYRSKPFQDSIQVNSSSFGSSDKSESTFLPIVTRRDCKTSQETGSGKGTGSGNSWLLFSAIFSAKKEGKVTPNNRSFFTKSIYKQTAFHDGDSQVRKTIDNGQRLSCLHRSDGCISSCSDTSDIQKYLPFVYGHQVFQFMALTFGMSLSLWIFTKLMEVIAVHLRQCAISLFP